MTYLLSKSLAYADYHPLPAPALYQNVLVLPLFSLLLELMVLHGVNQWILEIQLLGLQIDRLLYACKCQTDLHGWEEQESQVEE